MPLQKSFNLRNGAVASYWVLSPTISANIDLALVVADITLFVSKAAYDAHKAAISLNDVDPAPYKQVPKSVRAQGDAVAKALADPNPSQALYALLYSIMKTMPFFDGAVDV